ncbi:MAG: YqaA family protein [Desulfuromonadales bacterium]|nr:YqaA family protein [Desulfuromonadales bacterium]
MEPWLLDHGYPALFLLGFLAATLLPLGSEWLLVALLLKGFDPPTSVVVATAGNSLGALTNYAIGLWGGPRLFRRVLRISPAEQARAERWYARYGSWSLLMAWLPVVGDPLCLVGGLLRVGWGRFLLLVTLGKLGRYTVVAAVTLGLLAR